MPEFYVTHDGDVKAGPFDSWLDALGSVLSLQGQSFDWARKYEGWDIATVEDEEHES